MLYEVFQFSGIVKQTSAFLQKYYLFSGCMGVANGYL